MKIIELTVVGVPYRALEAGPLDPYNHTFYSIAQPVTLVADKQP